MDKATLRDKAIDRLYSAVDSIDLSFPIKRGGRALLSEICEDSPLPAEEGVYSVGLGAVCAVVYDFTNPSAVASFESGPQNGDVFFPISNGWQYGVTDRGSENNVGYVMLGWIKPEAE